MQVGGREAEEEYQRRSIHGRSLLDPNTKVKDGELCIQTKTEIMNLSAVGMCYCCEVVV
jgi:hypothetical protein